MNTDPIFSGLNDKQKEAVQVLSGPLLILAGAGSGKTRVLTHRTANLIANGVHPSEILAVTFTNKAAKEMESRIQMLLGAGAQTPTIGTFHSVCVRILRQEIETLGQDYTKSFVIFDTDDSLSLLKIIMRERNINEKEFKPKAILGYFSSIKSMLAKTDEYLESLGGSYNRFHEVVKELYPVFERRLIEHNALDFDDLLKKTVEVYENDETVLAKYRNRWDHVLVDEYQDTNFAQYRLIRLLADQHQNLCVVGDDHQSIYAFRGADYQNILDFENDFPNAKVVKLEQNYRSSANILNNANRLISHNQTGREKNLWTENEVGNPLEITEVFDEKDEGRFIAEKVKNLEHEGTPLSDMAILYRMNAQSRAIEEALMRHQIPYQIVGGTRFFDRREIKDIVAYLRLIFNPRDDVAFLRIINIPTRKLGPATLQTLKKYATEYNLSMFDILEAVESLEELPATKRMVLSQFREMILKIRAISQTKNISTVIEEVIEQTDFYRYLDDGTNEGEMRKQNVQEIFSVSTRYDAAEDPLAAFLEGIALISDLDKMDEKQDAITLMTIHASKGLEFPVVFLPGWEEGIFPSQSSQFSLEQLEEERRLGYVAITRAEKECFITHARQRMLFGKTDYSAASKFLSELDPECINREAFSRSPEKTYGRRKAPTFEHPLLHRQPKTKNEAVFGISENETEFKTGDTIRHAEFGEGTIIQIAGDVISAAFKGHGIKKIVASIAPIEKA